MSVSFDLVNPMRFGPAADDGREPMRVGLRSEARPAVLNAASGLDPRRSVAREFKPSTSNCSF